MMLFITKFHLDVLQFQQIMDALFVSFDASISVASFNELSGSVFSWLEEYCKPQVITFLY